MHRYTFGIEEEFFLTRLSTRNLCENPPAALFSESKEAFGEHVSHELLKSQIELVSPVLGNLAQAEDWLLSSRRRLAGIARKHGLCLVGSGTHPNAEWREQKFTELPRYERLVDDFQIVAQRNLLCGLHIHVAIPPAMDRVRVMNQILPWLPVFLALSTSSPFWSRKRTGLMSYRQAVYDEWPRTGIPDHFEDEPAYRKFVDFMVRTGSLKNESFLWWAIRPSLRHPTLELRICDACPLIKDVLCLSGLFCALVISACENPKSGTSGNGMTRLLIEENRWRAKRFGVRASFLELEEGVNLPIGDWLKIAGNLIEKQGMADPGVAAALARAREIVTVSGSSADRQLLRYHSLRDSGLSRRAALLAVVDDLIRETADT